MPKVFVTQEMPQFNYTTAEEFGDIVFLTANDWSPVASSMHNETLLGNVKNQLKFYNNQEDFIVMTGSPIIIAVAFMVLSRHTNRVQVLKWSNRDLMYSKVTIEV